MFSAEVEPEQIKFPALLTDFSVKSVFVLVKINTCCDLLRFQFL